MLRTKISEYRPTGRQILRKEQTVRRGQTGSKERTDRLYGKDRRTLVLLVVERCMKAIRVPCECPM